MKKKLPFVVNYSKEMFNDSMRNLKESGSSPFTNPRFYDCSDLLVVGSSEYNEKVKVKRQDVERKH